MANVPPQFYKPDGNHYHAPIHLWCIAREDRSHPQHPWLETHWIGSAGHHNGLALFLSKLDANIQCVYMNATTPKEKGKKEWKAYPFGDLDRPKMVHNMKFNFGQEYFGFCFVFGFAATPYNQIQTRPSVIAPLSFHQEYLLQEFLDNEDDAALEMPINIFCKIEDVFSDAGITFDEIKESNAMSDQVVHNLAVKAFKEMNYIPSENHSQFDSQYTEVGTYILRAGWVFTSFLNPLSKDI